jgi:hypothetical protein
MVISLALPAQAFAATVTLAWDPNTEPDIAGYRLSYGTVSGNYSITVDVGNVTQWTVADLVAGQTYFFAVRAYNTENFISDYSSQVNHTVPVVVRTGHLTYDSASGLWSSAPADQFGVESGTGPGWEVHSADFNADGWQDLFMYNSVSGAWVTATDMKDGSYSFVSSTWAAGWKVTVADLNGDRRSDVFLYNRTTGQWFTCLTTAPGVFLYRFNFWAPGWRIHPADFNGDGRMDLFLFNPNGAPDTNSGRWFRVLSDGFGDFSYVLGDVRWAPDWNIYPADFNGDGRSELFLYRPNGQWFRVFFEGTTARYENDFLWGTGWTIHPGHFNGDRRSDLFLYNPANGLWFVVTTGSDGKFLYRDGKWGANWRVQTASLNGDALTDLVLYNPANGLVADVTTLIDSSFAYSYSTVTASPTVVLVR